MLLLSIFIQLFFFFLFVIANEAFGRVASVGLTPNMILYLTREYGLETAKAATVVFIWSAANGFNQIIGAFLADSYLGKYRMVGFGSILSFLVKSSLINSH